MTSRVDRPGHRCDTHGLSVVSVVRVLSIVVIGGMGTMAYVALTGGSQVPAEIDKLTHAALGALVAMLSQTRNDAPRMPEEEEHDNGK